MKFHTHRTRRVTAAVAVLGVAALAAGCGGSDGSDGGNASGANGDTYVIGASLPLTGPTTVYGANLAGGLEAYINYVNENGGVNGKEIELVQVDGGFDTATTVQSLKKLAQSDPIAIGGLLVSGATEGAMSTIEAMKKPTLIASPSLTMNRPPANPYVFGAGGPMIEDEGQMMLQYAKERFIEEGDSPKVATIHYNAPGSVTSADIIREESKANGWDLVSEEEYTTGTTNFDAQAAKIAAADPDVIFYSADSASTTFIQALKNAGVTAEIITDQGGPHEDQMEALDYPSLSVLRELVYPTVGDSPAVTDYLARVKAVGGKVDATSHVTQYGYLQAEIIVKVLEECGVDCDSATFLDTLNTIGDIDTEGLTFGPVSYSKDSTAGLDTASFYSWDSATQKPVLQDGTYTYPS